MEPRPFASYSRSSPEREDWVDQFATELVGPGIHVILNRWDLREWDDAHQA